MCQFSAASRILLFTGTFLLLTIGSAETAISQPFTDGLDITTSVDDPRDVHTADIDGDGDQDVLSASYNDGQIAWYRNGDATSGDGDGSEWTTSVISSSANGALDVHAADIDGDGDQDVISGGTDWYENDSGDGTSWTTHRIGGGDVNRLSVADIDSDSDLDVVVTFGGTSVLVRWYENIDGDGTSWTGRNMLTDDEYPLGANGLGVSVTDVDDDGSVDVVASIYTEDYNYTEVEDEVVRFEYNSGSFGNKGLIYSTASAPSDIHTSDIDGDSDKDIISSEVDWYENKEGGWNRNEVYRLQSEKVYASDIDGDMDIDVISTSTNNSELLWHENTNGDGSAWTSSSLSTSAYGPWGVHAADIDGDGDSDILSATTGDDKITWYRNKNTTIPVELAQFGVQKHSEEVVLDWQTASEQNNAGFEVQRRISSEWESISFIEGAGTTSEPQTYRFRDSDVPYEAGSLTYRLKQVDTDGTTSFSDTRTLKIGAPDQLSLHAPFPNPVQGQVTLRYALPSKADVSIRVYDVMGREVTTLRRGTEDAGRKEIQVSTSNLSAGTYFVRMRAGEKMKTKRLTVVK